MIVVIIIVFVVVVVVVVVGWLVGWLFLLEFRLSAYKKEQFGTRISAVASKASVYYGEAQQQNKEQQQQSRTWDRDNPSVFSIFPD